MRTGTGPPFFPPSLPDSCRHQLPASRAACMVSWLFFLWPLLFLLVSMMLRRGTTGWIVSSWGGCLGICTASWYGTEAPVFSVTPAAIDGRLGLCCCCCTDACSWPTLKGQDIPWFRLAIYCRGSPSQLPSQAQCPTLPAPCPCSLSSRGAKGCCNSDCLEGRSLFFSVTQKCFPFGFPKCNPSSSPLRLLDKYLVPPAQCLLSHVGDEMSSYSFPSSSVLS